MNSRKVLPGIGSLICLLLVLIPQGSLASDGQQEAPRWSLELKGGNFFPKEEAWEPYYGDDKTGQLGAGLAWKITRQIEIGLDTAYIKDEGKGLAPQQGQITGNVTLELYPLQLFLLARGVFREEQWLVPYIGGGFTRTYYEQDIRGQERRRGSATGSHLRAGVQLLLDNIDRGTAWGFYDNFGVNNTYLFVEAQSSSVKVESIDLGGTSYQIGLLFEF